MRLVQRLLAGLAVTLAIVVGLLVTAFAALFALGALLLRRLFGIPANVSVSVSGSVHPRRKPATGATVAKGDAIEIEATEVRPAPGAGQTLT